MNKSISFVVFVGLLSVSVFAEEKSIGALVNGSSCSLKLVSKEIVDVNESVFPDQILAGDRADFVVNFSTSFFSSPRFFLEYDTYCEDQAISDGGKLLVFNVKAKRHLVACISSDTMDLKPGKYINPELKCGLLFNYDTKVSYVLRIINKRT